MVSQGKVEAIVLSQPRDRRLLIEEAAGLGKHRKRAAAAQLKLERTQDNLARALDVEREARSRLRPLKRQAEAAELHGRLERQTLEARLELPGDDLRAATATLADAEQRAGAARAERDDAERRLGRGGRPPRGGRGGLRGARAAPARRCRRALFAARAGTSANRDAPRACQDHGRAAPEGGSAARPSSSCSKRRCGRRWRARSRGGESVRSSSSSSGSTPDGPSASRRSSPASRRRSPARVSSRGGRRGPRRAARRCRGGRGCGRRAPHGEARGRATCGRGARRAPHGRRRARRRSDSSCAAAARRAQRALGARGEPACRAGYELALAAALGIRLTAAVVDDVAAGERLLDAAAEDGGSALVRLARPRSARRTRPWCRAPEAARRRAPRGRTRRLAERLLADAGWSIRSRGVRRFRGCGGHALGPPAGGATGELSQTPPGGEDRCSSGRNRRERARGRQEARGRRGARGRPRVGRGGERVAWRTPTATPPRSSARDARARREPTSPSALSALLAHRAPARPRTRAREAAARRAAGGAADAEHGSPTAPSASGVSAPTASWASRARSRRERELAAAGRRLAGALEDLAAAFAEASVTLEAELAAVARPASRPPPSCAPARARRPSCSELRKHGERRDGAEVAAQQARDAAAEVGRELREVAAALGLAPPRPRREPLDDE